MAAVPALVAGALADLSYALEKVDPAAIDAAAAAIAGARRIICYGVGREGPMMRARHTNLE